MNVYVGTSGGLKNAYIGEYQEGWQPGANTLLYLPLKSDINDASGNSRPTTSSGITFTTVGGVQTAHNSTSGYIQSTNQDFITSGMTEQTISCWFYVTSAQTSTRRFLLQFKKTSAYYNIIMIEANTNQIKVLNNGSWGGSGITVTANQWNNVVMTADNSTRKVYMNGSFIWSGATNSAWQSTSETNELGDFIMGTSYHSESLNGNMGDMIIESKEWTAQEISDYYNQTKANYGL